MTGTPKPDTKVFPVRETDERVPASMFEKRCRLFRFFMQERFLIVISQWRHSHLKLFSRLCVSVCLRLPALSYSVSVPVFQKASPCRRKEGHVSRNPSAKR